ncbi:hypothetical protein [Photobacterium sp. 1_MG-2023]|uniref:hypothetical protein n=1 Tax=Photobacterium sp. 1_MG-2023 TaxID=3062646 RepID=UPI0026E22186|nr:hypothetical protein [Photobacterium sp. 1_MG-2023]MDO6708810.1 hypothetical protein [Photobacterium sp. 1_MG-2023]
MKFFQPVYMCLMSVAFLMTGCGGGGDSSTSTESSTQLSSVVAINAANVQVRSVVGESIQLNLSNQVHTSNHRGFNLRQASVISGEGCKVQESAGNTLTISGSKIQDCVYQYEVESVTTPEAKRSAYVRMAVGETYADNSLPALVRHMDIADGVLTVNLRAALSAVSPLSELDILSNVITILGSGSAAVTDIDTITYTANEKGSVTLLYSYSDGDLIKQGTLVISVSDTAGNLPPTARTILYATELSAGQEVVIDTQAMGEDADGDSLQLINVITLNGLALLQAPDDVSNTRFVFSSTKPGSHDVIYTLSDHRGGIATGVIRIKVVPDFSLIQDWNDIRTLDDSPLVNSHITFTAPISKVFADYINVDYTIAVDDSTLTASPVKMVTMTYDQAQHFCHSRQGRLPLRREFAILINHVTSVGETYNWPVGKPFWSAEKDSSTTAYVQDLSLPLLSSQDVTDQAYVTCILFNNPKVKNYHFSESTLKNVNGLESALDLTLLDPDEQVAPFVNVDVLSTGSRGLFSNYNTSISKETDLNGQVKLQYFDASMNNDVILASANHVSKEYPAIFDLSRTRIDISELNQVNWIQRKTTGNIPVESYALTPDGMPLSFLQDDNVHNVIVNSYTQHFTGSHITAFYVIERLGRNTGYYSFFVHQSEDHISSWDITDEGILNEPTVYGALISFNSRKVYDIEAGVKREFTVNPGISDKYVFTWFEKRGEYLNIYALPSDLSDRPSRPAKPIRSIHMKNFDPNKKIFLVFSGSNNNANSSSLIIKRLNFAAY